MAFLLDTSVWIEYFKGSEKGKKIYSLLEGEAEINSCQLTISEISNWCCKNSINPYFYLNKIKTLSRILELSENILVLSGQIYFEQRKINDKISLIDAIIYTTAQLHGFVLMTTDRDFEGLRNVEFL